MERRSEKRLEGIRYSRRQSENPSFSSILLEAIYRSIDDKDDGVVRKKEMESSRKGDMVTVKRSCMVEKKATSVRRKSAMDSAMLENLARKNSRIHRKGMTSSSSSSESSSGGGFSSSETEPSVYGNSYKASVTCAMHFARRERTLPERRQSSGISYPLKKLLSKHGGSSGKSESGVSSMYSDSRKVKQPLSPGGKLASFLNSIFAGNAKTKAKSPSSSVIRNSTCSSASSVSRSCFNEGVREKSAGNINGGKRSVNFYPVTVILNKDSSSCDGTLQANKMASSSSRKENEEQRLCLLTENCRVEFARDILRSFQKSNHHESLKVEDEAGDRSSCSSSDLFELENLSSIGMDQRYSEELPVYETTHMDTNLAIANGLQV